MDVFAWESRRKNSQGFSLCRLVEHGLRHNFLLHLFNLWDNSLLNSRAIIDCMIIVDHVGVRLLTFLSGGNAKRCVCMICSCRTRRKDPRTMHQLQHQQPLPRISSIPAENYSQKPTASYTNIAQIYQRVVTCLACRLLRNSPVLCSCGRVVGPRNSVRGRSCCWLLLARHGLAVAAVLVVTLIVR